jgi:hypothetical protein
MSIEWAAETDNLVVCRISGELEHDEWRAVQSEIEPVAMASGKLQMLIILHNFEGWEKHSGWGDSSFTERNDQYVSKMAFVGEHKWQDQVMTFSLQGLRPVSMEYFISGTEDAARRWLLED